MGNVLVARSTHIREQLLSLQSSVFIGISGIFLTDEEKEWLKHPLVGGVILFARNYQDIPQLLALTASIKKINSALLISVDHEGGRVQRFREDFTAIPAMRTFGELYDEDPEKALESAYGAGALIAKELREVGVDFSYAPVCDLDYGVNPAIGDRAFHSDAAAVSKLVVQFYEGLKSEGSIGVAKHFPGHGFVNIDTHLAIAKDDRTLVDLEQTDLLPFKKLIRAGIEGMMPAHIIFSALDAENTAVTSPKWMQYLRETLGFSGVIISDDLDMKGADHLGTVQEKVSACFDAGINIVLLCNDMSAIRALLSED
ncbi:beta-N-acetylhexosaminidase [Ignatzschineria sp. LJL83]